MTSDLILQLKQGSVHSSAVGSQSHVRIIMYESYHIEPVWRQATALRLTQPSTCTLSEMENEYRSKRGDDMIMAHST